MKKRIVRVAVKIAKLALVLVLVLAVIYSTLTFILGRKLEGRIAALKASGQPVSVADINRRVPDDENAAVVFDKAMAEMRKVESQKIDGQDPYLVLDTLNLRYPQNDPNIWNTAKKVLELNANVIALAEEAAKRPQCQYSMTLGPIYAYPMYAKIREFARFFSAKARVEARDGKMDQAIHSMEMSFRAGEMYRTRGTIVHHLTLTGIAAIASNGLQEMVAYGEINEKQAKRLYDFLGQIDLNETYTESLRYERVYGINDFNMIYKTMPGPLMYADQLAYLDAFERQIKLAGTPYHLIDRKEFIIKENQAAQDKPVQKQRSYAVMSTTITSVLSRALTASTGGVASINGSRAFLAVLAYKNRFGSYPQSIGELKSKLGWDIPKDPFTGKDFIYRLQGNGFILYSVGFDMKDNGGTSKDDLRTTNQGWDQVWKRQR